MTLQTHIIFVTAASMAFIGVACGAFGAHALEQTLTPDRLDIWQTAVEYQMYHALGLFGVGLLIASIDASIWFHVAAWAFGLGIVVFSGSLYILTLTGATWLGMITPIGGVCFLLGWICIAIGVL